MEEYKTFEIIFQNISAITSIIFWFTSALFAWITLIYVIKEYNRNKFNVHTYTSKMTEIHSKEEYIMLKITNRWRRDVLISTIGYKWAEKNRYWFIKEDTGITEFPIKLWEWECYTKTYSYSKLIKDLKWEKLLWFQIEDSIWWKYLAKLSKETFKEIV